MLVINTLQNFWSLLDKRKRLCMMPVLLCLFAVAALELAGITLIFLYIQTLSGLPESLRPTLLLKFFESLLGTLAPMRFAIIGGTSLFLFFLFKNLIAILTDFSFTKFILDLHTKVSARLFESSLNLPYQQFVSLHSRDARQKILESWHVFNSGFVSALSILLDMVVLVMLTGLLLLIDPLLTLIVLVVFGTAGSLLHLFTRGKQADLAIKQHFIWRDGINLVAEGFNSFVPLRLACLQERFVAAFITIQTQLAKAQQQQNIFALLPQAINEVLLGLAMLVITLYFVWTDKSIVDAVPVLATFGFAGLRFGRLFSKSMNTLQSLRKSAESQKEVMEMIKEKCPDLLFIRTPVARTESEPTIPEPKKKRSDGLQTDEYLVVKNITFRYTPNKDLICNLSLSIKKGEFIGICGSSGCGKSTLALLITGLLQPAEGQILNEGIDIHQNLPSWQRQIGYIGHENFIFHRTIRENVAFDPLDIDDCKVWQALEKAQLSEFVNGLPEKLYTKLHEKGAGLSAGQAQRLCIARTLYRNPSFVIFDEATASLDNLTEKAISETIRQVGENKTVISIAHRLSTIAEADRIYFLHEGKIHAEGSYESLLQENNLFRNLASSKG